MPSLVLTYLLGVPFNFMTTGMLVFDDHGHASFWRFVVAYGVIYIFNVASYHLLVAAVGAGPLVAQAICLPAVAVFAFILFKVHVFRGGAERASGRRRGRRSPRG
jgi:putative flippase GtrA